MHHEHVAAQAGRGIQVLPDASVSGDRGRVSVGGGREGTHVAPPVECLIVLNSLYTGRVHAVREEKTEIIILHYMCETEVGNTDGFGIAGRRLLRFEF